MENVDTLVLNSRYLLFDVIKWLNAMEFVSYTILLSLLCTIMHSLKINFIGLLH